MYLSYCVNGKEGTKITNCPPREKRKVNERKREIETKKKSEGERERERNTNTVKEK